MSNNENTGQAYQEEDEMRPLLKYAGPKSRPITSLLGLLLLVNLSSSLYQLPLNRAVERRLCREFYADNGSGPHLFDGNIPEEHCKVDEVQKHLARMLGVMETIWIVGGSSRAAYEAPC
jgi:hypothetical protein